MNANTLDPSRNQCMLTGKLAYEGYDWWWHSFTAHHEQTGEEKSFFIEYFLCNPELAKEKPEFGVSGDGTRGKNKPSYMMVKAGTWGKDHRQIHRFFPWKDVDVTWGTPYCVQAGECLACDTNLIGSVCVSDEDAKAHPEWMSDAGSMAWDLELDKQIAFNVGYGASERMRNAQMFDMFWHAEGMKTKVKGYVIYNGQKYLVDPETSYGYSDKNWGCDFTTPWVWLSSWNMTSMDGSKLLNSAFDIGGGRPVVAHVPLERQLLSTVCYEGKCYEFNFSKPWTGCKTEFNCYEEKDRVVWHVTQKTKTAKMIAHISCKKDEMVLANYEAPSGLKKHNRLWNGGTGTGTIELFEKKQDDWKLIDFIRVANVGCEYGEYC